MLKPEKQKQALLAINAVLVILRTMAYEKQPYSNFADILDNAEYLPMLMLEENDRTELFRETLEGLVNRYPDFKWALEKFDNL